MDVFVEDSMILELKAQQQLSMGHEAQLLNYLKATDTNVGQLEISPTQGPPSIVT